MLHRGELADAAIVSGAAAANSAPPPLAAPRHDAGPIPRRTVSEVMVALQHWGSRWADLTPEQAHPGVVLWMWATFFLDRDRLPLGRKLVRFDYPTLSGPGNRGWLLIERGDAEICETYPGNPTIPAHGAEQAPAVMGRLLEEADRRSWRACVRPKARARSVTMRN